MPSKPRRKPAVSSTDALRRSGRGAVQTVTAASIIALINVFASHPMSTEQSLALTPILGWLLSFIQNTLEDAGTIGTLWKGPAEPTPPPADDETTRELLALAAANGRHQNDIERLEGELQDIRADIRGRRPEPEDPARIETRQLVPNEWPPGGLG